MASLLISGCISQTNNQNNNNDSPAAITAPVETVSVQFSIKGTQNMLGKTIDAVKGANAFEEMKKHFVVNYKETVYGPMVMGINGENALENNYWALYVDGNYSQVGINSITLDKNMQISWLLEQITMP